VRENTERPITITEGTNRLVPDPRELAAAVSGIRRPPTWSAPEGWDGNAGERIVTALMEHAVNRVR
jgi:UDP-N-acetylglucosamine 2-epimerase (non-hydrolysing)